MNSCPDDLKRLYRQRRIVPFIGAGASMSVEWSVEGQKRTAPSWANLVNRAAELLDCTPEILRARGVDLQILEYFSLVRGGTAPLTNWLSNELSRATDSDILQSAVMKAVAGLKDCPLYYTTNYDDFLERAIKATGRPVQVVTAERNMNHDRNCVEVVKFHGDFNSPAQLVVSETDYLKRMRLESEMDLKLRSDMLGRALLFIGYSFRDPNVNYIFHLVQELFKTLPESDTGRRAYIILPEPSEFERRLFLARNISVIPVGRSSMAQEIASVLSEMCS